MLGPNITGEFLSAGGYDYPGKGAFFLIENGIPGVSGGGYTVTRNGFDGSRVSDKYNENVTIQPCSGYALTIIKA